MSETFQPKFDVIMPVYSGTVADEFEEAFLSIFHQTVKPTKIIIVADGPVCQSVNSALDRVNTHDCVSVIRTKENRGSGQARALAIEHSTAPLIALMDSDDISLEDRFEKQLYFIQNLDADVVGGRIAEFHSIPGDQDFIRSVPLMHEHICKAFKWKNAMNHVTLLFKREAYEKAGGYNNFPYFEDYDLMVRMIISGSKFANQEDILVNVRTGEGFLSKRRGWSYLVEEQKQFYRFHKMKFIPFFLYLGIAMPRMIARIMPMSILSIYYSLSRKRSQ